MASCEAVPRTREAAEAGHADQRNPPEPKASGRSQDGLGGRCFGDSPSAVSVLMRAVTILLLPHNTPIGVTSPTQQKTRLGVSPVILGVSPVTLDSVFHGNKSSDSVQFPGVMESLIGWVS